MHKETKTPALGSEPTRLCTPEHGGRSAPLSPEEKKKKKRVRWQNKYSRRLMVVFEAKWAGETLGDIQTELRANYSPDDSHE